MQIRFRKVYISFSVVDWRFDFSNRLVRLWELRSASPPFTPSLLETLFRDAVANSKASYGRVFTSNGTPILSSGPDFPLSDMQLEEIKSVVKTGKAGQALAVASNTENLFLNFMAPSSHQTG